MGTTTTETENKDYTYRDLLNALSALTPDQLDQPARWIGEEQGGEVLSLWPLEEDYFNPSGDGAEPVSSYRPKEGEEPSEFDSYMSEEEIASEFADSGIAAGRVFINVL